MVAAGATVASPVSAVSSSAEAGKTLKVLLVNGSPRADGNTFCCLQDTEGMQTMRTLATNMAFLLKKIHADGQPAPKRDERPAFMSFIR